MADKEPGGGVGRTHTVSHDLPGETASSASGLHVCGLHGRISPGFLLAQLPGDLKEIL